MPRSAQCAKVMQELLRSTSHEEETAAQMWCSGGWISTMGVNLASALPSRPLRPAPAGFLRAPPCSHGVCSLVQAIYVIAQGPCTCAVDMYRRFALSSWDCVRPGTRQMSHEKEK